MPKKSRINKYIAECTGCSRRKAEEFINKGLVKLNGSVVNDLSIKVTAEDKVFLKGKILKLPRHRYIIFNKPPGYITTRADEKGRKTIYDLLPEAYHELKPVGRLDKDTSGLLLLTNDGDLINRLTHPKYKVPKRYRVNIKGNFTAKEANLFAEGVDIGEEQPAYADVLSVKLIDKNTYEVNLLLKQGYNRQIRRMFEKLSLEVTALKRISIGPLNLKGLRRAEYSIITPKELNMLLQYLEKMDIQE